MEGMVVQADVQNALAQALGEFGPAWKIVSDCSPVNPRDPSHWAVGSQSFHVNIRHRVTGRLKVLGRRVADEPSASLHRAVAHSLVDAYARGNAEPIRRYLEDIGVAAGAERDAAHFFRRPAGVAAAVSEPARQLTESTEAYAHVASVAPVVAASRPEPVAAAASVPVVAMGSGALASGVAAHAGEGRSRILNRFKRELEIWQWRRATGSLASKGPGRDE